MEDNYFFIYRGIIQLEQNDICKQCVDHARKKCHKYNGYKINYRFVIQKYKKGGRECRYKYSSIRSGKYCLGYI